MRRPQLTSTFSRAVVPVAAGIGFFAVIGLALWGVAAIIAHNSDQASGNLAPTTQEMGLASTVAGVIDSDGPIILNDLIGDDLHVVLDHAGGEFALYLAHPADRPAACTVTVVRHTHTFTDCDHRTLTVEQLATVPAGVRPVINPADKTLTLDLTPDLPAGSTTTT
jgi:hypothetical protein